MQMHHPLFHFHFKASKQKMVGEDDTKVDALLSFQSKSNQLEKNLLLLFCSFVKITHVFTSSSS